MTDKDVDWLEELAGEYDIPSIAVQKLIDWFNERELHYLADIAELSGALSAAEAAIRKVMK